MSQLYIIEHGYMFYYIILIAILDAFSIGTYKRRIYRPNFATILSDYPSDIFEGALTSLY